MNFDNLAELRKSLLDAKDLSGGSIARTQKIRFKNDPTDYVLKSGYNIPDQFYLEAEGLSCLEQTQTLRTPKVIDYGEDYILLEYITSGSPAPDFWQRFGSGLAKMHQLVTDDLGFSKDNFLGNSVQKNTPLMKYKRPQDWANFFWNYRLKFQWQLTKTTGQNTKELDQLFKEVEPKCLILLAQSTDPPSLLHGDLWSGNFLVDKMGGPVLIDPAVYYGNREAELAMTALFGGFPEEFYESYQQTWPLPQGWQERQSLYKLYHLLNHLNLFGQAYYRSVIDILLRVKDEF